MKKEDVQSLGEFENIYFVTLEGQLCLAFIEFKIQEEAERFMKDRPEILNGLQVSWAWANRNSLTKRGNDLVYWDGQFDLEKGKRSKRKLVEEVDDLLSQLEKEGPVKKESVQLGPSESSSIPLKHGSRDVGKIPDGSAQRGNTLLGISSDNVGHDLQTDFNRWNVKRVELGADLAAEAQEVVDYKSLICYLCQRQLKSSDQLRKHVSQSELHQKNLLDQELVIEANGKLLSARQNKVKPFTRKKSTQTRQEPPQETMGNQMLTALGWQAGQALGQSGDGLTKAISAGVHVVGAGLGSRPVKMVGKSKR